MSDIVSLTQDFYLRRREAINPNNSPEMIEANHVGWNSIANQIKGFEIATDLSWINWKKIDSVLDIGCGYANLLEFLISTRFYQGKYCGIDIVPEYIEKAIQVYSNKYESDFIVGDFLEHNWNNQKFDFVISLGALGVNYDYPNLCGQKSMEYAQRLISKIVSLSGLGVSLYFPNADKIDPAKIKPDMAYYRISEIEAMILNTCDTRCKDITFISFPDQKSMKTMAYIKLSL